MKSTFILSILSIFFVASYEVVQSAELENVHSLKMIRRTTSTKHNKGKPFIFDGGKGVSYECTPLPQNHHHKHHHPHHPHPHPHKSSTKVVTSTIRHSSTSTVTGKTSISDDPTSMVTRSTGTPISTSSTDSTSTITSATTSATASSNTSATQSNDDPITTSTQSNNDSTASFPLISSKTTSTSTSTSTATSPSTSPTTTLCPEDYNEVKQGDSLILSKSTLIALHGLTIDLNILNFGKDGKQESQKTISASDDDDTACSSSICCVKPVPGTCPKGFQTAKRGEIMIIENKGGLLDLSGLSIDLNILNFGGKDEKVSNGQKCEAEQCCYQANSNDLIKANGINIDLCILSGTC